MQWFVSVLLCAALLPHPAWSLPRILLYTKTAGYRHDSIPTAVETITAIGNGSLLVPSANLDASVANVRWDTTSTENQSLFRNATYLAQFDAIGFVSTTDVDPPGAGTVLDDEGIRNFAAYIQNGGGFFGIHSASATLFGAPVYGRLVGSYFDYHPSIQNVSYKPVALDHPSTSKLPADGFELYEEVYNFRSDPRQLPSPARLLVTNATGYQDPGVNPQGFRNGTNGPAPHPLAWFREGRLLDADSSSSASVRGGGGANVDASGGDGRMWYTSLGHATETWRQNYFRGHIAGGIGWVLQSSTIRSNNATALVGQPGATGAAQNSKSSGNGGYASQAGSSTSTVTASGGAGASATADSRNGATTAVRAPSWWFAVGTVLGALYFI
ncbi:hypothetical protein ACQY0O_004448 [Thecaphora frezii]